ncbi:MAG TPA: malto-oligosyltrehalose trehalohydrolase [Acidimicrobiales bacterium]|nr:malto-oligosyltrehalose trehalohydrolase [Acidimicrobiales bacterium]
MSHQFAVWAPRADRVEVVIDSDPLAMTRDADGWFRRVADAAGPGTRYGFSINGSPPRPDPRSQSQPDGVHDLSQVFDHLAYQWRDRQWRGLSLRGAILYEMHIGTFTPGGTFVSAIERIAHLVELGVDAVELMPIAEFSGTRGWGYDGVDLFAPHHAYGTPDDLKRLVDACHASGIGVVLDVVYNHLGPAGNYLSEFGPYFSDRHQTNWGDAINYDGPDSDEVRAFVIDNALMWLRDYHIDGLRLDAVHAIVDESAQHVLEELAGEVDALATHVNRPLFLIAESDLNDPRFVRSPDAGGYGLDAAWADEWHHALHAALSGERSGYYCDFGSLDLLAKALRQAWVYDGTWSPHRHRHHGRSPVGLTGHQFVVCTQNHDQVGNRALGERAGALMNEGRLYVAAALLLTSPFTPMLFQGEEWAASCPFLYFTDHADPELGRAVSEGRRREFAHFGWDPGEVPDPQLPETFERSKLAWDERERAPHAALLAWYRRLVALRRQFPALSDPRLDSIHIKTEDERGTLAITRGPLRILINVGIHDCEICVGADAQIVASSFASLVEDDALVLPPDSVAIVEVR